MSLRNTKRVLFTAIAAAAIAPVVALAGTSTNTTGEVKQGTSTTPGDFANNYPAITISFSGQTALRTFNGSPGISTLQPGSSITLNFGPTGAVPVTYTATNVPATFVQLGKKDFTTTDVYSPANPHPTFPNDVQNHSALRVEWHEQGSVQGQFDLINDQIGYVSSDGGVTGFLSNLASRGPSTANPTWVNSTSYTGGATINGHALSGLNFANTYDATVYDRVTGRNLQNGQDRIQFSVGEFKTESLAKNGTPSHSALPGSAGYGLGNPALNTATNTIGLGVAGGRQQLFHESFANQSTDKVDPNSTSNAHYAAGPWNTAGANNIDSKQIAVTAVTYSANPGTGLSHINKGDAQWLLTTGRLQNGADFNAVLRANDAGQRLIPSINVGVDPSWAVGENDDGNTSGTAATNTQKTLGPGFRFSGKTSGTEARNAIAQSRLGFGPLSLSEARGAASNAPVRALDVDFEHLTDTGNPADFVRANFDNIANFTYKAVLVSHYNTIKQPRPDLLATFLTDNPGATPQQVQDWWNGLSSAQTGIKGDPHGNVAAFINNITQSTGTAAAGITPASANNPADALFAAGFLIPGLLNYYREYDGGPLTPTNLSTSQLAVQADVKANYGTNFTPDASSGSNAQTIGSNSYYGARNSGNTGSLALNGGTASLLITAKDSAGNLLANGVAGPKGNYLFGNFNQDGKRDFKAVKESVNAVLSLHQVDNAANRIYTDAGGVSNATVIPSLVGTPGWAGAANTKGDLIILGDFNSDGAFDGADISSLARGASLSDSAGNDELTAASGATFGDRVRNPNAVLHKNAALDYALAHTNNISDPHQTFVRQTALSAAAQANDAANNYLNAFRKEDVNRDGLINLKDAKLVDYFNGSDYRVLDQQLAATQGADGDSRLYTQSTTYKPISLIDVELNDTGTINTFDFGVIRAALGSQLVNGDTDFNGVVNFDDYARIDNGFNTQNSGTLIGWSTGDFDSSGVIGFDDYALIDLAFNGQLGRGSLARAISFVDGSDRSQIGLDTPGLQFVKEHLNEFGSAYAQAFLAAVPEPGSMGLLAIAASSLLIRRRRRDA